MGRFTFMSVIVFFAIIPRLVFAEIVKLSDDDLKMVKAQSGFSEISDSAIVQNLVPVAKSDFEANMISDVSKSFDLLVSDMTGSWERIGNSKYENGVITLDETIRTKGISYDNIRIQGAGEGVKTFGSIHIGEASFQMKGQVKIVFRPD